MTVLDCPAGCPARRMGCHSSCNRYKLAAIIRKRKRRRRMQAADLDDFIWSEQQAMAKKSARAGRDQRRRKR